jgi:hypothetical protein
MRIRPLLIALGSASALTVGLLAPATAQAATAPERSGTPEPLDHIVKAQGRAATDGDDCSITGHTPTRVVLGIAPKTVQFGVSTSCDDAEHAMKWAVTGDLFPGSAHATWFGACNYTYTGPATLSCPAGTDEIDVIGTGQFKGNAMAGQQNAFVYAFDDANGNNRDDDSSYQCDEAGNCVKTGSGRDDIDSSIQFVRRTSWGSTFSATPATLPKGQELTLSGYLTRANWDTGKNEKFAPTVKLQFKANGAAKFKSVRTIQAGGATTSVKVTAKRSGTFRFYYPGDDQSAASASAGQKVTVQR